MARKPDASRIAAETLAAMLTAGGAGAATAAGVPIALIGMGAAAVAGIFKFLIAKLPDDQDPTLILERIQNERTASSVETIRDAIVEAMSLEPDFAEPIEELADAVQGRDDGRDEERFQTAILKLVNIVVQASASLDDIKAQTSLIPETHRLVTEIREHVRSVFSPQVLGERDPCACGSYGE